MARPRKFDETTAVRAAMELFWQRGYHATSTEDLCSHTGLSRSSLYGSFHNKRSLYLRCLREYAGRQWVLQQELVDNTDLDAAEKIRTLLTTAARFQFEDPTRRGCLAVDASVETAGTDSEVANGSIRNFDNLRRTIEQIVAEGQSSGIISAAHTPRQWALLLTSVLCGNHVLAASEPSLEPLLDTIDLAVDLLTGSGGTPANIPLQEGKP